MKFIDTVQITVLSGHGGAGSVHFHREKYVDKGGPDGGNGGRGGDVIAKANSSLSTLDRFVSQREFKADKGEPGRGLKQSGKDADQLIIQMPVGTVIENIETGQTIGELLHPNDELLLAKGGLGGLGNANFASSVNQTPTYAQPGTPGQELQLRLTLKLIADAGFIGLPNAGKSTLLSMVSNNDALVGDYPFTTLIPNLGVVESGERRLILADIPGIIEGASKGAGLGLSFLKHIERVNVIIYVIDIGSLDPTSEFSMLRLELEKYSPELLNRPFMILFNKIDQADYDTEFLSTVEKEFRQTLNELNIANMKSEDIVIQFISAKENQNIDRFLDLLFSFFKNETHAERLLRKR